MNIVNLSVRSLAADFTGCLTGAFRGVEGLTGGAACECSKAGLIAGAVVCAEPAEGPGAGANCGAACGAAVVCIGTCAQPGKLENARTNKAANAQRFKLVAVTSISSRMRLTSDEADYFR